MNNDNNVQNTIIYNNSFFKFLIHNIKKIFKRNKKKVYISESKIKKTNWSVIIKKFFTNPSNVFIVLLNALFFMIVQTLFFYFIASNQIDDIIVSKVELINKYAEYDGNLNNYLKEYINSDEFKQKRERVKLLNDERQSKNRKILLNKVILPFIIPIFIIFLIYGIFIFTSYETNKKWFGNNINEDDFSFNIADKILIFFVIFAFLTELIIFFGVIRQHEFIGDFVSINDIYKEFAKNYNK